MSATDPWGERGGRRPQHGRSERPSGGRDVQRARSGTKRSTPKDEGGAARGRWSADTRQGLVGACDSFLALCQRHLSATVVVCLAVVLAIGHSIGIGVVTSAVIVSIACVGLASGWSALTGVRVSIAGRLVCALTGIGAASAVAITSDLSTVTLILGIGIVTLVTAVVLSGNAPHDLSEGLSDDEPAQDVQRPSHARLGSGVIAPLAVAITGTLVVVGGAAWVALEASHSWSVTVLFACVIVVCVVIGDQLGRSFRAQTLGALAAGVLAGLGMSAWALLAGYRGAQLPLVLPQIAQAAGDRVAVGALGVATGIAVALAVIVIDGFVGEHERPATELGAIARGCAKFLVAAVPVYAMIRIGGA